MASATPERTLKTGLSDQSENTAADTPSVLLEKADSIFDDPESGHSGSVPCCTNVSQALFTTTCSSSTRKLSTELLHIEAKCVPYCSTLCTVTSSAPHKICHSDGAYHIRRCRRVLYLLPSLPPLICLVIHPRSYLYHPAHSPLTQGQYLKPLWLREICHSADQHH
ncbi:hypothetical protein BC628DRAFT_199737 [Trametes gibbosa]|nr:hypothetical protein BC628DRAFT_199737 [Trametes gibbosa]